MSRKIKEVLFNTLPYGSEFYRTYDHAENSKQFPKSCHECIIKRSDGVFYKDSGLEAYKSNHFAGRGVWIIVDEPEPKPVKEPHFIKYQNGTIARFLEEKKVWLVSMPDGSLYAEWAYGYLAHKSEPIETTDRLIDAYNRSIDKSSKRENPPEKIVVSDTKADTKDNFGYRFLRKENWAIGLQIGNYVWLIMYEATGGLWGWWDNTCNLSDYEPIPTTQELIDRYNQSLDLNNGCPNKPAKITYTIPVQSEPEKQTEPIIEKGNQSMLYQVAITMSPIQRAGQGYEDGSVLLSPTPIEAPSKEVAIAAVAQTIQRPLTELDRLKILCKPFAE